MNKFSSPFMSKSPFAMHKGKPHKKVDPDAPGTPGKPGYEPPVVREELDAKGKEIFDKNLQKIKEKERKEKKKKEQK